jgi:hypothetical protein
VVFLALDAKSAAEAIAIARQTGAAVWIGSDAMTHDEHYEIAAQGVNLTRFEYPLAGVDSSVVDEALTTVLEHHPGETVWVQRASYL